MIVQALVEYYDRLAANPTSGVAPIGWVDKPIGWLIRLDAEGHPKALESTYESEGKKRVAHVYRVPEGEHKQGINPRLLWDNAEYVFGISKEGAKNPERRYSPIQAIHIPETNKLNPYRGRKNGQY